MDENVAKGVRNSDILMPYYKLGKPLGYGTFAKVKLGRHVTTGKKVAIKILNTQMLDDVAIQRVQREIKILKSFSHPHIMRFYDVIERPSKIYIVMEYVNAGELFYYIVEKGRLDEDETRHFFQQIISAVEYCHLNMVAHRDLKPENILRDSENNIKIGDFGLSNVMKDGHLLKTSCGSPNYAAPEVISGDHYVGPDVDVWSCGVILYAFLCGRLPFDSDNISSLYGLIKRGLYTLPSHLSPAAKDLITRILVVDPMKRITIPEIRRHPWFQHNLPWNLAVPAQVMQRARRIEEDIIQKMIGLGFNQERVIESLQNKQQNQMTVTYNLLLDGRPHEPNGYLRAEFLEHMMMPGLHHYVGPSSLTGSNSYSNLFENHGASQPRQAPSQGSWVLGIQTEASPREALTEILRALQRLNASWKKIGPYNMKCKWSPTISGYFSAHRLINIDLNHAPIEDDGSSDSGSGNQSRPTIKFEIQLYKVREGRYLLDVQRLQGVPMLFIEICYLFLMELRLA
ncbi:SNF1-related protein kinase catalytic subunit alpha KIN10 [Acorus calamus]|uniref:non-specific serine/threonine protein kinase n=1 Tax=Acorus calamus TaxID=4465 RepID=A0AAV9CUY6_ACOCL|nr:SNF1-related protein kinase catalytic subunit alpha KIN10 [Acorus calamus]